uniref:Sir2 family NAD+-dependent deacetylase n=1 Tax=Ningiella ruwaisensis TaxID=2364274 RepID=UPI001F4FA7FF|nr:Sir2 family NAD+-dependent deacetylase [Ningiella ruwaisensis]
MNIVVLTGAGVSAESGISTFRDSNGLWENHRVEDVATPEGFARDPELVYRFYNQRRAQLLSDKIQPNAAHHALARLEQACSGNFTLVTQNVDDLHERAGSQNVLHMHGELLSAKCAQSEEAIRMHTPFDANSRCACCQPPNILRPDIVWFGEIPYHMDKIEAALIHCDLFISIGTSGKVYPAAGFVAFAKECGAKTVEINLEASERYSDFDLAIHGMASEKVPQYVDSLLQR